MKATSGPWLYEGKDKNGQAIVRNEHIEIATCWHHCVGNIEKEMEANARLIAAAPELLEALQEMVNTFCTPESGEMDRRLAIKDARAAITKATQP